MRRALPILGLVLGIIVGMTLIGRNRPERKIDRTFDRIEELVGKGADESNLVTVGKVRGLTELFHDPFEFRAAPFDFATRDPRTLAGAVQRYRSGSARVTLRIGDRQIEVDDAAGRATSRVTATFSSGLGDLDRDAYRFQVDWVEVGGDWEIEFVDLIEVRGADLSLR